MSNECAGKRHRHLIDDSTTAHLFFATRRHDKNVLFPGTESHSKVGHAVRSLRGHDGVVNAVGFSREGDCVISAGADGTVRLWQDDLPREPGALRAWIDAAVPGAGGVSR
jgi:WD40 repeat protein